MFANDPVGRTYNLYAWSPFPGMQNSITHATATKQLLWCGIVRMDLTLELEQKVIDFDSVGDFIHVAASSTYNY